MEKGAKLGLLEKVAQRLSVELDGVSPGERWTGYQLEPSRRLPASLQGSFIQVSGFVLGAADSTVHENRHWPCQPGS